MPRTVQVKLSPPKDRHCCLAFFPYDLVLSVPVPSSPAALPDTLFEEMILSKEGPSETSPPILERIQTWKACLDRKRDLVTLLAKVQGELEDCEGDLHTVLGEKKITIYHDAYYYRENFVDDSTDIAKFKKDVSVINFKPFGRIYGRKKAV
ncbi:hypothetical protein SCLCIDRAFT_21037 [Scleroderma citrinum Foug A]|uniref:Uncharacterized protein n=1 Tax=Scleroderma citrinum Foug A TaxID=1036808 RepID=A0A0C3ARE3_9AGAM|nr:hypothetical protein SCLCIDRAFT_21037 [Scleroderma citrinum Foug A]